MEPCLHRWDKVVLGLAEPMHENTKKAVFVSKVRNCPVFQIDYLSWKRKSDDDPTQILDTLRTAMKNNARRDKVSEDELRGLSGYTGGRGRQHTPAYAAGLEDNSAAPRTGTPAPNGGGRGRGRSRACRTQRSASPWVRSTASNDTEGKGKEKFDSRKMGCMYFNQGKGSCRKADRCTCPHDPNVAMFVPKGKGKGKRKGSNSPRSASPAGRGERDTPRGGSSPRRSSRGRSIDPARYKTKPCDNFARGTCTFGDGCTCKHND